MGKQLFSVNNVIFRYNHHTAVDDVSLAIDQGEFVGVIGPNGAGKSTLLRLLAGFLKPSEGSISYIGKDLNNYNRRELARSIATLPQVRDMPFAFTGGDYILMGRYPHAQKGIFYGKQEMEFVNNVMETMEVAHLKERRIDTLSEGERQKVFLSQCIAQDPRVLLLDEPVSHLDIRHQIQTLDVLEKLHEEGLTIVMVLHDLNLASEFCSRVVLISKGKIKSDGDPRSVLTFENIEEAYDTVVIVKENPLSGKPFVIPVSKKYLETP